MNKKKIIILSSIILVVIILIGGLFVINKSKIKKETKNSGEAGNIVDNNNQAIKDATAEKSQTVSPISETDHILGDIKAPVQIIVYDDFECSFCAKYEETLKKVREVFGDKVVIVYRHFPLRSNPNSYSAALVSECAGQQEKFWEMHDRLFADNIGNKMTMEQFRTDAVELRLDMDKFDTCYSDEKGKAKIQADIDESKLIGVTGSPQTFVNGKPLPGAYPFEDFNDSAQIQRKGMKTVIEAALKK